MSKHRNALFCLLFKSGTLMSMDALNHILKAAPEIALFAALALGHALGRVKLGSFSLGGRGRLAHRGARDRAARRDLA